MQIKAAECADELSKHLGYHVEDRTFPNTDDIMYAATGKRPIRLVRGAQVLTLSFTVKILKFGTPQTIAIIVLKIEKFDVTLH